MTVPIGLQLYSIREAMEKDFIGSLEKVKAAGYDCVEFAGYGGLDATDLRAELDRIGLKGHSSHIGWQQLRDHLPDVVKDSRALGLQWVVCPGYPLKTVDDCRDLADLLTRTAVALEPYGIRVAYHNHSSEFAVVEGRFLLDWLMELTKPGQVYAELDLCWAQYADVDPVAYLTKLAERAGPVHCKDINENYAGMKGEDINVEVGQGMIDFRAIFDFVEKQGQLDRGLIVEQEAFIRDPFESIAMSSRHIRATLREMGLNDI
ncbi:MAG: sugar phosphate isomerase/epimerase [Clostridia bacterium]|nr:sugar phosphate isomerase/epimerase [Clostridia bacterium]